MFVYFGAVNSRKYFEFLEWHFEVRILESTDYVMQAIKLKVFKTKTILLMDASRWVK